MDNLENTNPDVSDEAPVNELAELKERAKILGIKHSPNIGVDALRDKVAEHLAGANEPEVAETAPTETTPAEEPKKVSKQSEKAAKREAMRKDALRLVRLRITNMNPAKKDWPGEIITVANEYVGIVKKFIPFGEATDNGYHVPNILYKQLKQRKFQSIKTRKDPRNGGNIRVDQRWVPEFALEVMDPLTEDELKKLAAQQMAAAGMD